MVRRAQHSRNSFHRPPALPLLFSFFGSKKSRLHSVKVGTGTRRDGNGKPCNISSPTAISRPFTSLVYVPTVYYPRRVQYVVPVPLPAQLLPSHPDVRTSHMASPISHLTIGAVVFIPFTASFLVFSSYGHRRNWNAQLWIQQRTW